MSNTNAHKCALYRVGMSQILNIETFKEEKFTLW
jgi:hypothetical protein